MHKEKALLLAYCAVLYWPTNRLAVSSCCEKGKTVAAAPTLISHRQWAETDTPGSSSEVLPFANPQGLLHLACKLSTCS